MGSCSSQRTHAESAPAPDGLSDESPVKEIEFVRAVAEGDLVALHTHQIWPGGEEYVTMDFFRFDENGNVVEHWDSIQQVPSETKSGNPMYYALSLLTLQ
jgi:predicted SnoaL-like aldol condensation-catalyzing enzyme